MPLVPNARNAARKAGGRNYPLSLKITLQERAMLQRRARRMRCSVAEILRRESLTAAVADEHADWKASGPSVT